MATGKKYNDGAIPTLPEDIIADILSRLSVKCIVRFRCVSNPWRILISGPRVANLHLKRTAQHNLEHDHHTILTTWSSGFRSSNYNASSDSYHVNDLKLEIPIPSWYRYKVSGSCNGLIFLYLDSPNQILWNPSTRDYKVLPEPGSQGIYGSRGIYAFVGFGFDASIDDYKVVLGTFVNVGNASASIILVEVYTLKTNTWRRSQDIFSNFHPLGKKEGTFVNGALHWQQNPGKNDEAIVSFDLAREQFKKLAPLPPRARKRSLLPNELGVLQGCLCLCRTTEDQRTDEVWVMKEYGVSSSWSKLFCVKFHSSFSSAYYYKPLYVWKNGDVLMELVGGRLVRYSPNDEKFRHNGGESSEWFNPVLYVESVVSLNR